MGNEKLREALERRWPGKGYETMRNQILEVVETALAESGQDNPRGFCPDCHADLGSFYSNRINWYKQPAAPAGRAELTEEQVREGLTRYGGLINTPKALTDYLNALLRQSAGKP